MSKLMDDPEYEHRLLAIAAARMRSEGLTQKEIAKRLGNYQPEVSRLTTYAEDHQYLARWPAFLSQNVDPTELEEVDRRFFAPVELRKTLRKLAPSGHHLDVRVLPAADDAFAVAAANCVADWLYDALLVGIMWGRTLERMVSRIHSALGGRRPGKPYRAQCIPLCGDPVHLTNLGWAKYSASHLAARLGKAMNAKEPTDQPSLMGVPAYVPRKFFVNRDGSPHWHDFVQEIPGYRAIFGNSGSHGEPWIDRVDTIISGAGIIVTSDQQRTHSPIPAASAAHEKTGDFITERLKQEEGQITEGALARLIYGDIGGWLLGRNGLSAADQRTVQSLNAGWTGIRKEHLVRVARSARDGGAPGVILVAAGSAKAELILEAIRQGLVNELLIDESLAAVLS